MTHRNRANSKRGARRLARLATLAGLAAVAAATFGASTAQAATPRWTVTTLWGPTNLVPGEEGQFELALSNAGDGEPSTTEALLVTDELPKGVKIKNIYWAAYFGWFDFSSGCSHAETSPEVETLTCEESFGEFPLSLLNAFTGYGNPFPNREDLDLIYVEVEVSPTASGTGTNVARVEGGGSPEPFEDVDSVTFSDTPAPYGIREGGFEADNFANTFPLGEPTRHASDRPSELRVNFEFNQVSGMGGDSTRYNTTSDLVRTVEVTLPRGMIGNPEATPKCTPAEFSGGGLGARPDCPADTQIGYITVRLQYGNWSHGMGGEGWTFGDSLKNKTPIYNVAPPKGVPADLAFNIAGVVQAHIYPILDPAQNYAIKAVTPDISAFLLFKLRESNVTIWGVPADSAHDRFRYHPRESEYESETEALNTPWGSDPIRPFLTNPMDCGFDNGGARIRVDSYVHPEEFSPVQEYGDPMNVTGCNDPRFRFGPDVTLQPTDRHADAPTGLDVHLKVPQRNDEVKDPTELYAQNGAVQAIATPPMKKVVVRMPEGMTISPSAAQGLTNCSPAQIGLGTDKPVTCPDSSQYGTLTLHTPILPTTAPMSGYIYIAKQNDNPFHNFLSMYFVIEEPERGILVKIPGRIDLDPNSGQIQVTFDDLPQFPVSDMQLSFKGGVRAALVNPTTCGTKTIEAEFFSWQDPTTPHSVTDSYDVTQKPDGSPCINNLAERPFQPQLSAGSLRPTAGAFTPFFFRLTRTDDDQEFSQLGVTVPQGLLAKLAGVPECPEKAIEQAQAPERGGTEEQSSPSCPASSQIGTTRVGAGVGVPLSYVPGKVYLAGPYKGAPLSMVVITPIVMGPYDLGVIAVRSALKVNPETTQASVLTDPFPLIYKGIPVRIRDIRVRLDRGQFTLNPTSCEEMQIGAHVTGTGGNLASTADDTAADLSQRFQASDCRALGFKPKLFMRLYGGTHRSAHPKLRAIMKARPGDANIAWAQATLPHSEFLDQGHIKTVCTKVQFAAEQCPAASIYGHAEATTPLLDQPVKGPVYLRSSSHNLPDLVAHLQGQVTVDLVGRIDSINGGIRTTFETVPDAPVNEFTLTMQGGKKGLLVNSTELCGQVFRAAVGFKAHNGLEAALQPKVKNACGARAKHRHARR